MFNLESSGGNRIKPHIPAGPTGSIIGGDSCQCDERTVDVNMVGIEKADGHNFIFIFTEETKADAMRALERFAADARFSLSWYDAAVMSQKIRSM